MPNIINTNNGQDFSEVRPIILISPNGYSLADPTVKVIETNNGTDFSAVRPIILLDTNGNSL